MTILAFAGTDGLGGGGHHGGGGGGHHHGGHHGGWRGGHGWGWGPWVADLGPSCAQVAEAYQQQGIETLVCGVPASQYQSQVAVPIMGMGDTGWKSHRHHWPSHHFYGYGDDAVDQIDGTDQGVPATSSWTAGIVIGAVLGAIFGAWTMYEYAKVTDFYEH